MKKHIILLLPLVVTSLFSCGKNDNPTTSSTTGPTTTQEPPTTITPTTTHVTSTTEDVYAVEITEVVNHPSKVELNGAIDATQVTIKVKLSDNSFIEKCPDFVTIDFEGKAVGDTVECVCHYKELFISFNATITEAPSDVINYDSRGSTSTSYIEWTSSTASGSKFLAKTGSKSATKALNLKWDTSDKQIGIGMAKSQGKVTKIKITFTEDNSYTEGEKKSQIAVYGKETPFAGLKDFELLNKTNSDFAIVYDGANVEKSYEIDVSSKNLCYYAFKAIGSSTSYIKEIKIFYDENVKAPALKSISISGTPKAEINDSNWNFDEVTVTGNFEGGIQGDLTSGCTLFSEDPIPTEITSEYTITVAASYIHEEMSVSNSLVAQIIGPLSVLAITQHPDEVALNQPLDVEEVLMKIRLSNGVDVERKPTSIDIDWTGKSAGDTVEVVCNYLNVSKSFEATVVGGISKAFEVVYGTADSNFSLSNYKKDTTNLCYTEDNKTVDSDGYIQYKNETAYWTESPNKIVVKAKIGGGSTKTLAEGYEVRAALLNADGNIIEGSEKIITSKIEEKTGKEYEVEFAEVDNVAGVRLIHKKLASYNTRIYSFSLEYIS